jgi:hypothetical protein
MKAKSPCAIPQNVSPTRQRGTAASRAGASGSISQIAHRDLALKRTGYFSVNSSWYSLAGAQKLFSGVVPSIVPILSFPHSMS